MFCIFVFFFTLLCITTENQWYIRYPGIRGKKKLKKKLFISKITAKQLVFSTNCLGTWWYLKNYLNYLVAQWLRIRLPMQRTWVRALVWEDPTCRRATKPLRHNY